MRHLSSKNSKHKLGYHVIFCPKYRKQIFDQAISIKVKEIISQTCVANNWILHEIEVMPDHVHLFIQVGPEESLSSIIRCLKSVSAVYIFEKFPTLKGRKFWGSGLWSRGTYYATVGAVSSEAVVSYIQSQKNDSSPRTSLGVFSSKS